MANANDYQRLEAESNRSYSAFIQFLEMGKDRSLQKVAEQTGMSLSSIKRWSMKHAWQERSKSFDLDFSKIELKQAMRDRIERIKEAQQKELAIANVLYESSMVFLVKMLDKLKSLEMADFA